MKKFCIAWLIALSSAGWSQPEVVRNIEYGQVQNQSLKLDFYPASQPKAPLLIFVHGGGWCKGSRAELGLAAEELHQAGFAIASIDYRLVPNAVWPAQLEDVKCAIRYLRGHAKELGLDGQRFGAWGESAGAHLVNLAGLAGPKAGYDQSGGSLEESSSLQAVVDLYGPSDFNAPDMTTSKGEAYLKGLLQDKVELRPVASPVSYIAAGAPPFLILHGTDDVLVPFHQAEILRDKLKEAGNEVELITVPKGGHGFAKHPDRQALVQAIVRFFKEKLAPRS